MVHMRPHWTNDLKVKSKHSKSYRLAVYSTDDLKRSYVRKSFFILTKRDKQ